MNTLAGVQSPVTVAGHAESPSTLTESPSTLILDLTQLPQFDTQLDALLPQLAALDDAHLINLAATARRLEACAFRLRGACVAELRRRIKFRLTGGRGRRDTSGAGAGAHLARLAENVGVSISTLKTDARIHEVFFAGSGSGAEVEETRFAREPSLAREFYVTALGAPDPHAAIRLAAEKCVASNYKREDFRRDVLALKQAAHSTLRSETIEPAPKIAADVCIKVLPEARPVLAELTNRSGQTSEAIVAEALLAYHRSLTLPQPILTLKKERRAATAMVPPMQPSLLGAP